MVYIYFYYFTSTFICENNQATLHSVNSNHCIDPSKYEITNNDDARTTTKSQGSSEKNYLFSGDRSR